MYGPVIYYVCPPSCSPSSHHLGDGFKVTATSKSQLPSSSLPFQVETCLCYACVKVTEKVSQPCSFVWVDQTTLKALETSSCAHTRPPRHTYINQCIYIYIKIPGMYVNQSSSEGCCPHPVLPDECSPVYLQAPLKPDLKSPLPCTLRVCVTEALFLSRVVLHFHWICTSFAPGWFLHILLKDFSLCCHGGAIFVYLYFLSNTVIYNYWYSSIKLMEKKKTFENV